MKKIAKLSLVAAVAVAGLTSANATALEQAIKGVDISGTATYRYDDRDSFDSNYTKNSYKVVGNLKSSINDDLTFNSRTIIGSGNDMVGLDTHSSDGEATFGLSHANFAYTGLTNTTVIAGKQAVPSPFAVQADSAGDEDTGTGLTAVANLGVVTVAATYLNQTNLNVSKDQRAVKNDAGADKVLGTADDKYGAIDLGGQDIAGLGLMANVGPVALDAWYLDMMESSAVNDGHQAYTVGAKAKVEMVDLYARYSAVAHDATGTDTESLWKVGAKSKLGIVSASLDYGQTNDVKTVISGVGITGDADADVNLQAWALNLNQKNDASLIKATLGVDLTSAINLSATYADLSVNKDGSGANITNGDASEYYGQLTYKMGKNFMTYARIGETDFDSKTESGTRGRLHVQYTF